MISIAIQAYFDQMRKFFERQGFDPSTRVIYAADAEEIQKLLDTDIANKKMPRKGTEPKGSPSEGPAKDPVRNNPYTYLAWKRSSLENVIRRSMRMEDTIQIGGPRNFKKTVSAKFEMTCFYISNKANLIEDFEEAFAAEYQNMHTIPANLKFAYNNRNSADAGGYDVGINMTVIQELGESEMVAARVGNLFTYTWHLTIYLPVVSEFAAFRASPLKTVIVDLYSPEGVPIASMDMEGKAEWVQYVADDGTQVTVPKTPYVRIDRDT